MKKGSAGARQPQQHGTSAAGQPPPSSSFPAAQEAQPRANVWFKKAEERRSNPFSLAVAAGRGGATPSSTTSFASTVSSSAPASSSTGSTSSSQKHQRSSREEGGRGGKNVAARSSQQRSNRTSHHQHHSFSSSSERRPQQPQKQKQPPPREQEKRKEKELTPEEREEEERLLQERALQRQKEVMERMQANLRLSVEKFKHIQVEKEEHGEGGEEDSDEEELEDDDDDEEEETYRSIAASTLKGYEQLLQGGEDQGGLAMDVDTMSTVERIRDTANVLCMICFKKIARAAAIWQCGTLQETGGCYRVFHLLCIQKWARTKVDQHAFAELNQNADAKSGAFWPCPNCRKSYQPSDTPMEYYCFCGKTVSPENDLWTTPHSCGQRCGKKLQNCDHECTLLCHPGPCPPCPATIEAAPCHCGQDEEPRRCCRREWSCGELCDAMLPCGQHSCAEVCHPGTCPPCQQRSKRRCRCGRKEEVRPCHQLDFQCGQVCGRPLSCGHHKCQKVCHAGDCGGCPQSGPRLCPCGKQTFNLPCTQKVPSCGDTCNKMLSCGQHNCIERCHNGECPPCRLMVNKTCRCGRSSKLMQCSQEYICERKCQNLRNCGKHQCKRRCCLGDCSPCQELCSRKLQCKNHRCETTCHRGDCLPCPLTVDISCRCGATVRRVPCGAELFTEPPKCRKACRIPPSCHHKKRETHRCHYGDCPPCKKTCDVRYKDCEHSCKLLCHDPLPPPTSPYNPRKKRKKNWTPPPLPTPIPVEQVQCPPCPVIVQRACLGKHAIRAIVCSGEKEFQCGNKCDNPLECGNHRCTLPCHTITRPRIQLKDDASGLVLQVVPLQNEQSDTEKGKENEEEKEQKEDACTKCKKACIKSRPEGCSHACPLPCHPGPCPPCEATIQKRCHCGIKPKFIFCYEHTSSSSPSSSSSSSSKGESTSLDKLLCCNNICKKLLPNCTHLCSAVCHKGECPEADTCKKKTKVKCPCGRLVEEWECQKAQLERNKRGITVKPNMIGMEQGQRTKRGRVMQVFNALLSCDEECRRLKQEKEKEEAELRKRRTQQQAGADGGGQNDSVVAKRPKQMQHKRTSKKWKQAEKKEDGGRARWWMLLALFVVIVVLCGGVGWYLHLSGLLSF